MTSFYLQRQTKWKNASSHKTVHAYSLCGSATMQLGWSDRFYSRYVHWSFLIITVKNVKIGGMKPKNIAKIKKPKILQKLKWHSFSEHSVCTLCPQKSKRNVFVYYNFKSC